ncbi:shikimate dehydrogenase [Aurantiacibacter gangjinensis]|uniref:Shikimate dehydrogenase (NADP(+)) n=1 Tax=Aurantiacibacter gangjinensis TaxID=502682 RepID=A0A0G9MLI3_9SPHN|nr:shikimate dehydrogenase [Aurantiacibacter gangjinensis]APE27510.1 Shikimate 5-dehydrogenase I alpha [Aurantiacibacter gangjinensis]KLE31565.1 shikimate dehydrogenase [Aurantiacibacter gangjinensis]
MTGSRPYAEVIGDPIVQSKSPAIHNYWLSKLGRDARYDSCLVTSDDLADYLAERAEDHSWLGCNVTMPHKQAIIPHLSRLDPVAQRIGAVNTVVREDDGSLVGYNTDAAGFLEPLRERLSATHLFRMARIFGTGGAARAIVASLLEQKMTLVLAGRSVAKARAMLADFGAADGHHVAPLAHFAQPTDFAFDDREGCFDLVVNTTPLGMHGQPPLEIDFSHIPPGSVIYDIVTHPAETAFLIKARERGFDTVDGLSMLIGQAAVAFEKFFGVAPPREDGDKALRQILS